MIKITDTKNMIGIKIHGDYEDLNALYDALHHYLRFYFDHQDGNGSYYCYETILGLCYDIRHAFQGDRYTESVENNHEGIAVLASCIYELDEKALAKERRKYKDGNLYFNVDILYPLAVFYLFALQDIVEDIYHTDWFENDELGYTEYQAEQDIALITYFVHLLWNQLRTNLPEEVMHVVWEYTRTYNHIEYYFYLSDMYMEWLSTYWVTAFSSKEARCQALPLLCLELSSILDEDEAELLDIINQANEKNKNASGKTEGTDTAEKADATDMDDEDAAFRERIRNYNISIAKNTLHGLHLYDAYYGKYADNCPAGTIPYMDQNEFEDEVCNYVDEHGSFTDDSYEEWLDKQFGEVDWDRLEW